VRYDFLASPKVSHQVLSKALESALDATCYATGIILYAPLDVHFDEDNVVQPDLIYITNENMGIIQDDKIVGAPDLLVEVMSPITGIRDKTKKRILYEKFGVKEYWIVDPVHLTVDQFALKDGKLGWVATLSNEDTLASERFPCIAVNFSAVFGAAARFRMVDED
jgi:Uma2 family endonuclease